MKHGGMCICVLNSTLSEGLPVFEILRSWSNSSLLLPVKIIGPESIFPFVPFGNSYWPPPGMDAARGVLTHWPILQVSSG